MYSFWCSEASEACDIWFPWVFTICQLSLGDFLLHLGQNMVFFGITLSSFSFLVVVVVVWQRETSFGKHFKLQVFYYVCVVKLEDVIFACSEQRLGIEALHFLMLLCLVFGSPQLFWSGRRHWSLRLLCHTCCIQGKVWCSFWTLSCLRRYKFCNLADSILRCMQHQLHLLHTSCTSKINATGLLIKEFLCLCVMCCYL